MGVELMGDALVAEESPADAGDRSKAAMDKIMPILKDFIEQAKRWDLAKREGVAPKEFCAECQHKDWAPVPFSEEELEKLEKFAMRLNQEGIFSIRMPAPFSLRTIKGMQRSIEVKSKRQLMGTEHEFTDVFATPNQFLKKRVFKGFMDRFRKKAIFKEFGTLLQKFEGIECCLHLKSSEIKASDFVQLAGGKDLVIYCEECRRLAEKRGCKPNTYSYYCNIDEAYHKLNHVLLRKVLTANNLQFEETKDYSDETNYWIPAYAVLITGFPERSRRGIGEGELQKILRGFEHLVVSLSPTLVVCFSRLWGEFLITCRRFGKDMLIADLERGEPCFYKYRLCEKSVEKIMLALEEKLEPYIERAKERNLDPHEMIIQVLDEIGEELGYLLGWPKRKACAVDSVWLDQEGKVAVAIEVEHTGDWQKDIISTWENEPNLLAIITTYHEKDDFVPRCLMKHPAMKFFPAKLLYLNMTTKNGYLLDKQEMIKVFPFGKRAEEEKLAGEGSPQGGSGGYGGSIRRELDDRGGVK